MFQASASGAVDTAVVFAVVSAAAGHAARVGCAPRRADWLNDRPLDLGPHRLCPAHRTEEMGRPCLGLTYMPSLWLCSARTTCARPQLTAHTGGPEGANVGRRVRRPSAENGCLDERSRGLAWRGGGAAHLQLCVQDHVEAAGHGPLAVGHRRGRRLHRVPRRDLRRLGHRLHLRAPAGSHHKLTHGVGWMIMQEGVDMTRRGGGDDDDARKAVGG